MTPSIGKQPGRGSQTMPSIRLAALDTIIILAVGPEKKRYSVHKSFLTHYSEHFSRALNGPWEEAKDRVIGIEDVETGTFDIFLSWIYYQKLPTTLEAWLQGTGSHIDAEKEHLAAGLVMLKCCAFGDRFRVVEFLSAASREYIDHILDTPPYDEEIIYAFNNLPASSTILKALVDSHCEHYIEGSDKEYDNLAEIERQLPQDFLLRVMKTYSRGKEELRNRTRCSYHEHKTDEEKEASQKDWAQTDAEDSD